MLGGLAMGLLTLDVQASDISAWNIVCPVHVCTSE